MAPQAVTVSFRLGGDDGVSVEARKWQWALHELGFETRRVAGVFEDVGEDDDITIAGLAIGAPPDTPIDLTGAFDGADLLIVDNICSLPINLNAAYAVAHAAAKHTGRVLFRHHDLPWQRRHLAHLEVEFPPKIDDALHATINLRSRRELQGRGYEHATAIHNYFDLDPAPGDRAATRAQFGFTDDDFVCFQPARAIERKNVPGGLRFAQRLAIGVQYWLSGPAEDGYESTLEKLMDRSPIPVTLGRANTAADAYAAADLVVFPSTWEGFGNPIVEAVAARKPCATFPYPVLTELVAGGIRTFSTESPEQVVRFLAEPPEVREQYFDVNVRRARVSYSLSDLPAAIDDALATHGWIGW